MFVDNDKIRFGDIFTGDESWIYTREIEILSVFVRTTNKV